MPRNKRERERRNIGKKATRHMTQIMAENDHKCFWCKKPLVVLREIPPHNILEVDHGSITYRVGEIAIRELIASVDHKVGLIDGGTNDIENLVPSCRYCNEKRGRQRELEKFFR